MALLFRLDFNLQSKLVIAEELGSVKNAVNNNTEKILAITIFLISTPFTIRSFG